MASPRLLKLLLLAALALCIGSGAATAQGAKPPAADPLARFRASLLPPPAPSEISLRQSVYVPAYSSLVGAGGPARLDFAVTLAVRNTSATLPLVVERIDYYDTNGNLVERYIPTAVAVRPLGTIEILIATDDLRGGTGANFLVDWGATQAISEPVVEAVMVGSSGTRGFAFVSPGHPIRVLGK
ncbi:MAG TPA: DUF3124 domain-containing protein [Stellaceae bacterium]|nr:DUF3124 domain-containing protein [Stellaceae bacterium]